MSPNGSRRTGRSCGAGEYHQGRIEIDDEYRQANERIEEFTGEYLERKAQGREGLRGHIVTIPIVVHVVHNTEEQNITEAQIRSQINVLNEDFRANNADVTDVPTDFEPVIADTRIEFELASRDPDCNPTNGITRTETDQESFVVDSDGATETDRNPVKFDSSGGTDGWPPDEYLNIWVCPGIVDPVGRSILGYASFPAELATRPDEDGVVIEYESFGNTGTVDAPFDLGRTATHEVGHWLNLYHIWGNAEDLEEGEDFCDVDDGVDDTPLQGKKNRGCPSHPSPSCDNDGDMFMNYMDYVDDDCMVMFTAGQSDRMEAALFGPRADIVGSDALLEPTGDADLWMQDTPADRADEPNTQSDKLYRSNDIWVRRSSDGIDHQQHQNPVYRTMGDRRNYVYVRVRCDGCRGDESGTLKLYWAKASSALSWPEPWDGSVTSPALMGGIIDSKPTGTIDAGDHTVLEFPWEPPNPSDYSSFGGDRSHFCLLARIETESTDPYGMTFAEGSDLSENVRNNNNIVWKNIHVTTETADGGRIGSVLVGGLPDEDIRMRLQFDFEQETQFLPLLRRGRLHVQLDEELYERWSDTGFRGDGIEPMQDGFLLVEDSGWIGDFEIDSDDLWPVDVTYEPRDELDRTELAFLDLTQLSVSDGGTEEIGGQRFTIHSQGELPPAPESSPEPDEISEVIQEWLENRLRESLEELNTGLP